MVSRFGIRCVRLSRCRMATCMVAAVAIVYMATATAAARAQLSPESMPVAIEGQPSTSEAGLLDDAADVGQAVGVIALLFLWWQIRRAAKDVRDARAVSYQERFGDREFRSVTSRTLAFLDANDAADCVRKLRAWLTARWADEECLPRTPPLDHARPARNDIQQTIGFFESVGTVFNRGDLTREVIVDTFATVPVQIFTTGWWFICFRRSGELMEETETFREYERLVRYIRRAKPDLRATWKPAAKIRVLCLPKLGGRAPASAWTRCEVLSQVLSTRIDAAPGDDIQRFHSGLIELRRAVDHVAAGGSAGEPLELTLLGIPSDLEMTAARWSGTRSRLDNLAHRLSDLGSDGVDQVSRRLGAEPIGAAAKTPPPAAGVTAIIDLRLGGAGKRAAFDALVADLDQLDQAMHVTGRFDYRVRATCADTAQLHDLVLRLETELDALESETRVVLDAP